MPPISELGQSPPKVHTALEHESAKAWIDRLAAFESPGFTARRTRRQEQSGAPQDPIVWSKARGSNVVDVLGNVYVDLSAGFGVNALGHAHPAIVNAIKNQSEMLIQGLGDLHPSDVKIKLLERLAALSPWDDAKVALGVTGADALTIALKTAVLKTNKPGVLAFEGGYHGLSYAPLSICGYKDAFRDPFHAQLNPCAHFIPWPTTLDAAKQALKHSEIDWSEIGAIVVEPIQARAGVRLPPEGFLSLLRQCAQEHNALLIFDEIYTGLGRCGSLWLSEEYGIAPDLLCVGKALGGGMPISAVLGPAEIMQAWGDPKSEAIHTGTFYGHPVCCAAALACLETLEQEELLERSSKSGRALLELLMQTELAHLKEIRGKGLLIGIELDEAVKGLKIARRLLEQGYLVLPSGADAQTLQLSPPFNIASHLLEAFTQTLAQTLESA